jgi:malonyl-CoA decarboxylase
MPGFADWLRKQDGGAVDAVLGEKRLQRWRERHGDLPADGAGWLALLDPDTTNALPREAGLALAAHYLAREHRDALPVDPVARFHLGNGACVEQLNWAADLSRKGRAQSGGMMVNYLYVPEALDDNLARLGAGSPRMSRAVSKHLI